MLSARLYSSVLVVTRLRRARLTAKTQLAADNELSVKNGAELLDRLIKDIVAESAASYVSMLHTPGDAAGEGASDEEKPAHELPTAFSLERFLPLLEERINVLSPFTRMFLVAWITLLDSIPDLELVAYLPRFLGGLFRFLSDENQDVYTATQTALDRFLSEIRKIARIKQGIAESKKSQADDFNKSTSSFRSGVDSDTGSSAVTDRRGSSEQKDDEDTDSASIAVEDDKSTSGDGDWMPGQDVQVDHPKILEILVRFLETPFGDKGMQVLAIIICPHANACQKLRIAKSSSRPCVGSIAFSISAPKR
jgi:vacuole morphology and inheritance protein 14